MHKFDLEERTYQLGKDIVIFCKSIRVDTISESVIKQLIRCATSVGANYMEANGSDSKKDFRNKISICKKEAKETMFWLRIISNIFPDKKDALRKLWVESHELSLIFGAINKKSRSL